MGTKSKEDLIYNSGMKLFGKYGVKRVSIDMIVKDAGIAKGTFYLYYKNKEVLYERIIDDIFVSGKTYMEDLVVRVPDIKERFYLHMIGSLGFFKKNDIIKNLIEGNTDYYIGKINHDFLHANHIRFMKILLGNDFTDETFVTFIANTKCFFANVINHNDFFQTDKEFEDFVMNLAAVIVNGLFSDYKELKGDKSFKDITACVPNIKK